MLAEIYGWFTKGFDTADLQEAKALLAERGTETERAESPTTQDGSKSNGEGRENEKEIGKSLAIEYLGKRPRGRQDG